MSTPAPKPVAQPAPAPTPAPAPQPIATPIPQPHEPANMVPSWRVREETEKRRQFEQQATTLAAEIETLRAQMADLTPKATRAEELEAALSKYKTAAAHRIAMARLSSQRPALAHDSIQDFLLSGYEKATAGQEEPPTFDAWLTTVEEANDPLYAPHLKRAAGPDPRTEQVSGLFAAVEAGTMTPEQAAEAFLTALTAGPSQPAAPQTPVQQMVSLMQQAFGQQGGALGAPTGNPNGGTRPTPAPVKTYTNAEIQRIKKQNGGRLPGAVRDALLRQLQQ